MPFFAHIYHQLAFLFCKNCELHRWWYVCLYLHNCIIQFVWQQIGVCVFGCAASVVAPFLFVRLSAKGVITILHKPTTPIPKGYVSPDLDEELEYLFRIFCALKKRPHLRKIRLYNRLYEEILYFLVKYGEYDYEDEQLRIIYLNNIARSIPRRYNDDQISLSLINNFLERRRNVWLIHAVFID